MLILFLVECKAPYRQTGCTSQSQVENEIFTVLCSDLTNYNRGETTGSALSQALSKTKTKGKDKFLLRGALECWNMSVLLLRVITESNEMNTQTYRPYAATSPALTRCPEWWVKSLRSPAKISFHLFPWCSSCLLYTYAHHKLQFNSVELITCTSQTHCVVLVCPTVKCPYN